MAFGSRYAPRPMCRQRYGASTYRKRMGNCGRWGYRRYARPSGADGNPADSGADLRSGFRGLLLWVPSWPVGAPGVGGDTRPCQGRVQHLTMAIRLATIGHGEVGEPLREDLATTVP